MRAALIGRFFRSPADDDAMARVLTFVAPRDRLHADRADLYERMAEIARTLDSCQGGERVQVSMAFCVAPDDGSIGRGPGP